MHRCEWAAGLLLALALGAGAALAQAPASSPVPPDAEIETAPVSIDGVELFRVRGLTGYPAERRAQEIAARVERLAADPSIAPESLVLAESQLGLELRSGRLRILTVTEADADLEGLRPSQLAAIDLLRIQEAMRAYREGRSADVFARALVRTLVASAIFVAALLLSRALSRRMMAAVERRIRHRVQSLARPPFEFVRTDRLWTYLRALLRGLRWLVGLAMVFIFIDFSLRQFPWTRGTAAQLDEWMIGPLRVIGNGLVAIIPNLIFLAVLFVVTRWALSLLRLFFDGIASGTVVVEGFYPEWAAPTLNLLRLAVIVFAVVVAYPYIPGSDSAAFKGISLFLGLIVSLGSSSSTSNIIAGYTMTYRRLFREGDRVRIGDVFGTVTKIRLQVTHIRTPKNEEAVLPNSSILNTEVINYSTMAKSEGLILHTAVGIGYETPWRQVEAMLLLAAERTPGLAPGRQPFVLQTALGDFAVTYELNVHTDDPSRILFQYADLHRQILDVFNEYGIQIMTPAYRNDPEQPKIVPREQWFNAPAAPATPEQGRPGAS